MEYSIFEHLKQEALYAQRSFSTNLLYQTYGKAQMARKLEAITQNEFNEINHMTVYFMNTDKEYIRHENMKFFNSCTGAAGNGQMKEYRVKFLQEDGTEEYLEFETMELAQNLYDSLDGKAEI